MGTVVLSRERLAGPASGPLPQRSPPALLPPKQQRRLKPVSGAQGAADAPARRGRRAWRHAGPAAGASVSSRGGDLLLPRRQHLVERVPADGRPGTQRGGAREGLRTSSDAPGGSCPDPAQPERHRKGHLPTAPHDGVRDELQDRRSVQVTRSHRGICCRARPAARVQGQSAERPLGWALSGKRTRRPSGHTDGCWGLSRVPSESLCHQPRSRAVSAAARASVSQACPVSTSQACPVSPARWGRVSTPCSGPGRPALGGGSRPRTPSRASGLSLLRVKQVAIRSR